MTILEQTVKVTVCYPVIPLRLKSESVFSKPRQGVKKHFFLAQVQKIAK